MSIRNMEIVWHYAPYKGEKLLVLLALADWSNSECEAWPSYDALAKKSRVTERGAIGIIEALLADGVISIERGGGRGVQNRYKLNLKLIREKGEAETVNEKQCLRNTETDDTKRVKEDAEKGERGAVPIREPSKEPSVQPSLDFCPDRLQRLFKIFHRRPNSVLDARELRAYRSSAELCPIDEFELVEAYYLKSGDSILRRDLATLLNNWNGEVDRARAWASGKTYGSNRKNFEPAHGKISGAEQRQFGIPQLATRAQMLATGKATLADALAAKVPGNGSDQSRGPVDGQRG